MATNEAGGVDAGAYAKLSPWPKVTDKVFYSGCYPPSALDKSHSPWPGQCFMTVDVSTPDKPRRLASVPTYDAVASPAPPAGHIIWKSNYPFAGLPTSTHCKVNWADPDIATGRKPAPCWDPGWNTHVINGDVEAGVRELKAKPGRELQVHGSGELLRWLLERDLVDELNLRIAPVVVGDGRRLFPEHGQTHNLELVETISTPSGVMLQTYRPAGRATFANAGE